MRRITPAMLKPVTGTLQALDNQWVPGGMLTQMLDTGADLGAVATARDTLVRDEFIRGLINLESVVINRASLVNTPALATYLDPNHDERADLMALFREETLVPFLTRESSAQIDGGMLKFDHDRHQIALWNNFHQETGTGAELRLSWENDQANDEMLKNTLGQAFHHRILTLSAPRDTAALAAAMGIDGQHVPALRIALAQVAAACVIEYSETEQFIQREFIYQNFVIQDGTFTHHGRYDRTKPFAAVIKQCADLIYNTNLPDALDRYPLTPAGSPSRSVLQEFRRDAQRATDLDCDAVLRLLRGTTFAEINETLCLSGLGAMHLGDVRRLRSGEEWNRYIAAHARALNPTELYADPTIVDDVFRHYVEVARRATELIDERRRAQFVQRWKPVMSFVLEVAGRPVLRTICGDHEMLYQIAEQALPLITNQASPAVLKLCITGWDALSGGSPAGRNLENTIVLTSGRLQSAREQVVDMVRRIKEDPAFHDVRQRLEPTRPAGLDDHG